MDNVSLKTGGRKCRCGGEEKVSDLLLHQVLQLGDLLCILRMTGDVLLIKERLDNQTTTTLSKRLYLTHTLHPNTQPPFILKYGPNTHHNRLVINGSLVRFPAVPNYVVS